MIDKIKMSFIAHKILKILKWMFLIFILIFIILLFWRYNDRKDIEKTNIEVAKIHNTKLTLDDVMGKNLPPDPGSLAGATVQGVDANSNGIRDDVEIAIFKEYPNSAKTRAVLLQYALALQMQTVQTIFNTKTVTEVVTELSRADTCLADTLVPGLNPEFGRSDLEMEKIDFFIKFLENKQFNNEKRKKAEQIFYESMRSYGESTNEICDIDISKLTN
ncbi:MAG: hypothetical protein NDI62_00020 [Burkholderiales bacterium]|nr:hypothetical protein [Burkholderiales bacterium]